MPTTPITIVHQQHRPALAPAAHREAHSCSTQYADPSAQNAAQPTNVASPCAVISCVPDGRLSTLMTWAWLWRSTPPSAPPTRKNAVDVEHVAQHQRLDPIPHLVRGQLVLSTRPA